MTSKYRSFLVWNVKEAEELEQLLNDADVKSVNIMLRFHSQGSAWSDRNRTKSRN